MPAQYRGLWCERDGTYYRCREATSESSRLIRRDGFNITEEGDCRVYAVTPIAKGHRLRMRCTGTSDEPELVDVNLRLDARGPPAPRLALVSISRAAVVVFFLRFDLRIDPMKYATLLGLAILMASSPAAAKVDRACLRRRSRELGITPPAAQAKRVCNPKNKVKPHEWGWLCEGAGTKIYKVKGAGARLKRDVLCE